MVEPFGDWQRVSQIHSRKRAAALMRYNWLISATVKHTSCNQTKRNGCRNLVERNLLVIFDRICLRVDTYLTHGSDVGRRRTGESLCQDCAHILKVKFLILDTTHRWVSFGCQSIGYAATIWALYARAWFGKGNSNDHALMCESMLSLRVCLFFIL